MTQPPINQFLSNVQKYEQRGQSPSYMTPEMFSFNPVTRVSTPEAMAMMSTENQALNSHGLSQLPRGGVLLGPWSQEQSASRGPELLNTGMNQGQIQLNHNNLMEPQQNPNQLNQMENISMVIRRIQQNKEKEMRAMNQNIYQ